MVIRKRVDANWLVAVYAGAAIVLVPWIVILWFTQPHHGIEHNAGVLAGGLLAVLAASTLATGLLYSTSAKSAIVSAAFAGSLALATLWFRLTAQPIRTSGLPGYVRLAILLLPFALSVWSGGRWLRRRDPTTRFRLVLLSAYGIAALLVLGGAFRVAAIVPQTTSEHHLRLVWTGLDVIELFGLAWTAWCVSAGSRFLVFAAPFTAAFLVSDAWTNVVSTTGHAEVAAVGMAAIELSLAALSLWIAVRMAGEPSDSPAGLPCGRSDESIG